MTRCIFSLVLCAGLITAGMALAADDAVVPPPFPEFTFKRVKPPASGEPRIRVQIDPSTQTPAELPADAPGPAVADTTDNYAWYWSQVSPELEASGPGRLEPALQALGQGPDGQSVPAPRLQTLAAVSSAYGIEILKATVGTRVSPALVLAVIGVESAGRPAAISAAGAVGLMQLMPDTAARFGVSDTSDPVQNIQGGVAYLDWLMKKFDEDPLMVLAGYNAGENAVLSHDGVPPFDETRAYVPKVLAAWGVARGLCLTPPMLVTDGCVFAAMDTASDG